MPRHGFYGVISITAFFLGGTRGTTVGQPVFVNWETPHVHPVDITPDGRTLLAVNLADNRLEVFDISSGTAVHLNSIFAGLDPVSVRARTDAEAWVVSHVSDSINIVDLTAGNVVRTLATADEPCDVVFAGTPRRAFVSCSQANELQVFNLADLTLPPLRVVIQGEDPRSMAVSADGSEVYVAIFESGNRSTILGGGSTINNGFPPNVVNDPLSPYFNSGLPFQLGVNPPNPPPNDGNNFRPLPREGNPPPPRVGMIVKKTPAGQWMDDNAHDWTHLVSGANAGNSGRPVGWDLSDHDVAIINTTDLSVRYATGVMNLCMALAVNPANGEVTVVGTDGTNQIRFEPVIAGRFLRVNLGRIDPMAPTTPAVTDLNPHLVYANTIPFQPIPQVERDLSLGDPRAIVWHLDGQTGYVAGMGSNNVVVIDRDGARAAGVNAINVGEGPTGLALDEGRERLYVMNKFAATISVIDTRIRAVVDSVPLYDPTPAAIKIGRKHLYDTHRNSGLGHIACASCHVDGRMDRLAWDLGDPGGSVKPFNQNCAGGGCLPWHPMKGPMTTQTLQDIIGKEPHHWRGDRNGLEEFAGAFRALQGDDAPLPPDEMQEYEDFLATIHFPPNPFRTFGNDLPPQIPLSGHFATGRFGPAGQPLPNGRPNQGLLRYRTGFLDGVQCVTCHALPTGIGTDGFFVGFQFNPIPPGPNGERHHALVSVDGSTNVSIKIPQLRNLHEKVGFESTQVLNSAGFGFLHDGSVDSLARFVNEPVFNLQSDQDTADMVAFMLAFAGSNLPQGSPGNPLEPQGTPSQDTHAAVGRQTTLIDAATAPAPQLQLMRDMIALADANEAGLVVKGVQGGIPRGYAYLGANLFQSDRVAETIDVDRLRDSAAPGSELTYTVVPERTEQRIGIDRDEDGHLDRDELDGCSNPADPTSVPPQCPACSVDADCDDGIDCTIDRCDPDANRCVHTPDDVRCDNGRACDGLETCDTALGCVPAPLVNDCNTNGVEDACDIADGTSSDCQPNDVPDGCDIADGTSRDDDGNGIPDECPVSCVLASAPVTDRVAKNRYLTLIDRNPGLSTGLELTFSSVPPPYQAWSGRTLWVGPPRKMTEIAGRDDANEPAFWIATLQCDPWYTDWGVFGTVHVYHEAIVPMGDYFVTAVDPLCPFCPECIPEVLRITNPRWGDIAGPFDAIAGSWSQPDDRVDITVDVVADLEKFANQSTAPTKPQADVEPALVDQKINISDVTQILNAFRSLPYPFAPSAPPNPCAR